MYTNLACRSLLVSLSLLFLSRSLLLLSLSCLLILLAMVSPSWHSEYSPLSFKCSMLVHHILLITIRTCDVPLSIVLYRLLPVDYTRRSNDIPLSIVFYCSPPGHATFQRRTIDYRPVWGSLRLAPITRRHLISNRGNHNDKPAKTLKT